MWGLEKWALNQPACISLASTSSCLVPSFHCANPVQGLRWLENWLPDQIWEDPSPKGGGGRILIHPTPPISFGYLSPSPHEGCRQFFCLPLNSTCTSLSVPQSNLSPEARRGLSQINKVNYHSKFPSAGDFYHISVGLVISRIYHLSLHLASSLVSKWQKKDNFFVSRNFIAS